MTLIIITLSITMQNSPTIISTPPPLSLPPPPRFAGEVIVLPALPPPIKPFAEAPNSVFQITVLAAPPPPPFPAFDGGGSSSVDLSPLEFLLALVAIVTIPALIYTFIFAFGCSLSRRRERSTGENSGELSVVSELSRRDLESVPAEVSDVKYKKETHSMEIGGECPVCLSVFSDGEEVRQLSVCKHSFHTTCIDLWLSNHSNCPICRATIAATATTAVKSSDSNRDGDLQQNHRDASSLV